MNDAAGSLPSVEPDDFWKHLREWDFCSQYANSIRQQNAPDKAATADADLGRKPLPNVFVSGQHYKAAWAPLQLAECRAQLLQGATRQMSTPLQVIVKTASSGPQHRGNRNNVAADAWMEGNETGCYVQIRVKHRGQGNELKFMPNDLVLLVTAKRKDILRQIQNGTVQPPPGTDADSPTAYKVRLILLCVLLKVNLASIALSTTVCISFTPCTHLTRPFALNSHADWLDIPK